MKHAEYIFSLRGVHGLIAVMGTLFMGLAGVKLFLDSQNEIYILFSVLGLAGLLLTIYGIVSKYQWGCYVDDEGVTWWSKVVKEQKNSISHAQIAEIHFNYRGEHNSITIVCPDGNIVTISDNFIGDGKAIVKALVQMNPDAKYLKN
ncbi:hypothetical protein OAF74_03060 [bacterium]|jgi:hypothetical protein|nr:hypothetical protein [Planctomicrobium sp.]MDB4731796.1 hypothetical protein [bacterium]